MPDFTVLLGAPALIVGVIMLLIRPNYFAAGVVAVGLGILGWSLTLALATFGVIGVAIFIFGNPFAQRRRTSISTGRPDGSRTGSSPSNTP